MRILVVGSGGVGDAVARIAARRAFFERMVVADVDLARAQRTVEAASAHDVVGGRFEAAVGRRVELHRGRGARARARRDPRAERRGPAVRHADLRGRAGGRRGLPRHGDVAVPPAPGRAVRAARRQARRRAVRGRRRLGVRRASGPRGHRRRARPVRRLRAVRGRPPVLLDRRAGRPRRREPRRARRRRRTDLRALVLDLDDDRGVPEPAGHLVRGPRRGRRRPGRRLVHGRPVPRAGGVPVPGADRRRGVRARRARGGAPHAAVGGRPQGHVQVRARRGVHRRAAHAAHPRSGQDRAGDGPRGAGSAPGTSSPPPCPTRRRSARA